MVSRRTARGLPSRVSAGPPPPANGVPGTPGLLLGHKRRPSFMRTVILSYTFRASPGHDAQSITILIRPPPNLFISSVGRKGGDEEQDGAAVRQGHPAGAAAPGRKWIPGRGRRRKSAEEATPQPYATTTNDHLPSSITLLLFFHPTRLLPLRWRPARPYAYTYQLHMKGRRHHCWIAVVCVTANIFEVRSRYYQTLACSGPRALHLTLPPEGFRVCGVNTLLAKCSAWRLFYFSDQHVIQP